MPIVFLWPGSSAFLWHWITLYKASDTHYLLPQFPSCWSAKNTVSLLCLSRMQIQQLTWARLLVWKGFYHKICINSTALISSRNVYIFSMAVICLRRLLQLEVNLKSLVVMTRWNEVVSVPAVDYLILWFWTSILILWATLKPVIQQHIDFKYNSYKHWTMEPFQNKYFPLNLCPQNSFKFMQVLSLESKRKQCALSGLPKNPLKSICQNKAKVTKKKCVFESFPCLLTDPSQTIKGLIIHWRNILY